MEMDRFETLICALLQGQANAPPAPVEPEGVARFLEVARSHGVLPLLNERFVTGAGHATWPSEIVAECRTEAVRQAMLELAHRRELPRVLGALADEGIKALVLKGGALAYTHYAAPALRPRSDTDLLIPPWRRLDVEKILPRLGYQRAWGQTGDFVSYQAAWSREDDLGATHWLDVHWRISNSQILANLLTYQELEARAAPLPPCGPRAYALAPVDALLFACIHRAGHANVACYVGDVAHRGGNRLIWLYDIHLLVCAMPERELDEFAALATAKRIRAICLDGLRRSEACFATPVPPRVLDVLGRIGAMEPSTRYLSGGGMRQMAGEFLALERWRDRARWVRETVFPSAAYVRQKYADSAGAWLPYLYARRAFGGLRKLTSDRGGHTK
jgi:hypothetical protein